MQLTDSGKEILFWWCPVILFSLLLSSCFTIYDIRKYPKNKPFLFKNNIEVIGSKLTTDEKNAIQLRMIGQLGDSSRVLAKDKFFVVKRIDGPVTYDSSYTQNSVANMKGALLHLGYYSAKVVADTALRKKGKQQRVTVNYFITPGVPTIIDTFSYQLQQPALQTLALASKKNSFLKDSDRVTKLAVLSEISRLVDTFRNNGYYKFSSDDLKMRGDSTIASLTSITADPVKMLEQLAEANEKRNHPSFKLMLTLNPLSDTSKFKRYFIRQIKIYPDYREGDDISVKEQLLLDTTRKNGYLVAYHQKLFRNSFLEQLVTIKKNDLFRQSEYNATLNNFSRAGVWQNISVQFREVKDTLLPRYSKDSTGLLDVVVQLLPANKLAFESNLELSYSASSNTNSATTANAGNLFGLSLNSSLQNRNLHKEGIRMTHSLRTGVELNLNNQSSSNRFFNSTEFSYNNITSFPKLFGVPNTLRKWAVRWFDKGNINKKPLTQQSFINLNPAYTKRIDLFNLFSTSASFGNEWSYKANRKNVVRFPNIEYSYLFNQSDSFNNTLSDNPYLRYSYNTALVVGATYSYSSTHVNPLKPYLNSTFKWNVDIGLPLGILEDQLRQYVKTDVEYTHTISHRKSQIVYRGYLGIGIPLERNDSALLPFFKQYFSGGANSMRAWPIRGIGPGAKPSLAGGTQSLNDRSGDIKLELNAEYRTELFTIIPNSLKLNWAIFTDIGNVWNARNTRPGGGSDSLQFQFKNLYKQLGVAVGTGLRFDFNYAIIRFDFGFRVKRPDVLENDGWQIPDISLNNLFARGEQVPDPNNPGATINDNRYRNWRSENFNFTIGLSYPF